MSSIPHTAIREYPRLDALPTNLKYIFDTSDQRALKTIIVTSYETHKARTATKKTKIIPGVSFKKPRFDDDGNKIYKIKPKKEQYWVTNHIGVYSLLIGDEVQKIKNLSTGIWSILYTQSFRKTLLATATPMYNHVRVSIIHMSLH